MGGRNGGRRPLPTAVKAARGTLQPCRTNPDEPKIPLAVPEMPEGLPAAAVKHWAAWSERLMEIRVLTAQDGPALEALVMAELRVRAARRAVTKFGAITADGTRRTAYALELDAAEVEFRRWCVEFGVTPAARTRVRAAKQERQATETARDRARARFFGGA